MPEGNPITEEFLFGVATAGFQIEGGYNGPGEPRNNWFRWEAEGHVEPAGLALDFWNHYEQQLDRVVATGSNAFRFSIEWARCEPADGQLDDTALARYGAIVDACHERGLEPLVTLHHFTHPYWLGEDFWLQADSPQRFAAWAGVAAAYLGDRVKHWVTINELNILGLMTYLLGDLPGGGIGQVPSLTRALDHLLAGHVLAYEAVHAARPDAVVATNTFSFSLYEIDRLLTDVLLARAQGVDRDHLRTWLSSRPSRHAAAVVPLAGPERVLRGVCQRSIDLDRALPRTVEAVYASPHAATLDHVQIDYYNPVSSSHIRVPGHRTSGGRNWMPGSMLWDDVPDPALFSAFTELSAHDDRDVWIVENGLCNRVRRGRSLPRLDNWDRPRYLQSYLRAMVELIDAGVPIGAYFHWTLADNYEWGSYEPRFGLYGVDRARGVSWSDRDSMGRDSAGVYRRIIEGLRAGDRSVLTRPVSQLESRS